jgi:hypothetical protein
VTKPILTPDLARDFRDIQRRLTALEAAHSGPRFYGPFTSGSVSLGSGAAATTTWTHNLNIPGAYGALAWVELTSGPVPRWAILTRAANSITFSVDLSSVTGASVFALAGFVLVY